MGNAIHSWVVKGRQCSPNVAAAIIDIVDVAVVVAAVAVAAAATCSFQVHRPYHLIGTPHMSDQFGARPHTNPASFPGASLSL